MNSNKISLTELQNQFRGRKFGELVLHHISTQEENQRANAIKGIRESINPEFLISVDSFIKTITFGFAKTKEFWKTDCGEALLLYTNSTKAEAKKMNLELNDEQAFDIFNLIVLNLASHAMKNIEFKSFIKKSIRKFGFF